MIRFQDVSKEFSPNKFGVKQISFAVDNGEFVFITGTSGSGKTTLMRLIIREYAPTSGEVSLFNEQLATMSQKKVSELRRKIGVVFQDYKLLPELNVWENIALPLEIVGQPQAEIESRVTDLLKLIGLIEKPYLFPSQLSGGEAQRVGIARALALGPELIFADEPTGNLDAENTQAIVDLLKKINQLGTTVLFATHDLSLTKAGQIRILNLDAGSLIHDSKPKSTATPAVKKVVTPPESKPTITAKKKSWLGKLFTKPEQTTKKPVENPVEKPENQPRKKKEEKKSKKEKATSKKVTKQVVTSQEALE
ncbi:MAG: ATP-binding cassette domain-containing protein [Candidatus Pacebacteria bacterium]|nr:ATP-binding cassette domain-containing protein [Candidatus Paceibacterota bacterium]